MIDRTGRRDCVVPEFFRGRACRSPQLATANVSVSGGTRVPKIDFPSIDDTPQVANMAVNRRCISLAVRSRKGNHHSFAAAQVHRLVNLFAVAIEPRGKQQPPAGLAEVE